MRAYIEDYEVLWSLCCGDGLKIQSFVFRRCDVIASLPFIPQRPLIFLSPQPTPLTMWDVVVGHLPRHSLIGCSQEMASARIHGWNILGTAGGLGKERNGTVIEGMYEMQEQKEVGTQRNWIDPHESWFTYFLLPGIQTIDLLCPLPLLWCRFYHVLFYSSPLYFTLLYSTPAYWILFYLNMFYSILFHSIILHFIPFCSITLCSILTYCILFFS